MRSTENYIPGLFDLKHLGVVSDELEALASQAEDAYPELLHSCMLWISDQRRFGHSASIEHPEKSCSQWNSEQDTVKCFYLFGTTVLESIHPFGRCPWKLLFINKFKEDR